MNYSLRHQIGSYPSHAHIALNRIAGHFQASYFPTSPWYPAYGANDFLAVGRNGVAEAARGKLDGIINLRLIAREQVCGCLESALEIERAKSILAVSIRH